MAGFSSLLGSVGANGRNAQSDVKTVQAKLKELGLYNGAINGHCDMLTTYAIRQYQSNFMFAPDGLVSIGSETWKYLSNPSRRFPYGAYDPCAVVPRPVETKKTLRWPLVENCIRRGMTNHTFGMVRTEVVNGQSQPKPHQGWDLYAPVGTLCYAIGNGKVVRRDDVPTSEHTGLGSLLIIEIDSDVCTIDGHSVYATYAHLSSIDVSLNARVTKCQLIGKTGITGNAYNMSGLDQHLHFELRKSIWPGTGLQNRFNPTELYGNPPMQMIVDPV
jgi:hypothetical protein